MMSEKQQKDREEHFSDKKSDLLWSDYSVFSLCRFSLFFGLQGGESAEKERA